MSRVFDFTRAIVREPGASAVEGLRTGDAPPSVEGLRAEHRGYVEALGEAGLAIELLPPLEAYPDALFVEDPAFVVPEGAILLKPGAPSRAGEVEEISPALEAAFGEVHALSEGHADGGDVLILPHEILIGLSARTDRAGAAALAQTLATMGRRARIVDTPAGVLHFKTACALIDEETVIATPLLGRSGVFAGMEVIETAEGEEAAANLLRVNDRVLAGASYPRTCEMLTARGYDVVPLPVAEVAKLDAGLSCMSLRW